MTDPALLMLIERLLWPIPRVRWEVARALARLIREGHKAAAGGLLSWISGRRLESEAVLGLGIIDAFDLGSYFEFADVSKAVRAPSHLSDFLLKRSFHDARKLSPFRYAVSPPEPATLPQHEEAWFDRYRKSAVPPIFSCRLTQLQQSTGLPVRMRWRHDWRWLQATFPRSEATYPHFFAGADRHSRGQFDVGQRELYVSAYLRTLAYYAIRGPISHEVAEDYALLALTMNRGLADLEPVDRPDWARNLLRCDAGRTKELAEELWENAEAAAKPDEVPLALRVFDFDATGFVEFELTLTIGPSGIAAGPAEAKALGLLIANEHPGEMTGLVGTDAGISSLSIECPFAMTQGVVPEALGHVHTEMALDIRLASPYVFGTSANVRCGPSEIRLEAEADVVSRWVHWYSDWAPTLSPGFGSDVGSMTTVSRSHLDRIRTSKHVEIARLVRIRRGARREFYEEYEIENETYWARSR